MGWTNLQLMLAILLSGVFLTTSFIDAYECGVTQTPCKEKCIPIPWLCDGELDCPDGSDEQCELPCNGEKHAWQCDDGKCIPAIWKCDGNKDCVDGSDEMECACPGQKVQCPNSECIDEQEVCDGHKDCEDGSDEKDCLKRNCLDNQWMCKNKVCIMKSWTCDGKNNCGDSSDEEQCGSCDELMCDGSCINGTKICNEVQDCADGSDEGKACGYQCTNGNGGCTQLCNDMRWGVKCSCQKGWTLAKDGLTCVDIDECASVYSLCHQTCHNSVGSFTCGCIAGFGLQGPTACQVLDNATQILLATKGEITIVDARTGIHQKLCSLEGMATSIAYDLHRESYFWIDERKTLQMFVVGRKTSTSLYPDVGNVSSLSVEWSTGQLYWASRTSKTISVGRSDGRGYVTILEKNIVPDQLIVYPINRYMYWVNFGRNGNTTIQAAGMDGSDHHFVTFVPMEQPLGLTLDYITSRLYWISEYKESIETINTNGSGRFTFPDVLQDQAPIGLSLFEKWIFLADDKSLFSLSRDNLTEREVLYNTTLISAFTVLHELQQPGYQYPCSHGTCSHICLLSPVHKRSFKCACPAGMFLSPSGKCDNLKIMTGSGNEINLLEFGFKGTFQKRTPIVKMTEKTQFLDFDWKRNLIYWTDTSGQLKRSIGASVVEIVPIGNPACLLKVDVPTGNIYWLSCEKNTIYVTKYSGIGTKAIYTSKASIRDLFLNWENLFLYLLEDDILKKMDFTGGDVQVVLLTSKGFTEMALDLKSHGVVWRSTDSSLHTYSYNKVKLYPLAENFTSVLMDAYEPYIVSYSDPLIEIWDRKEIELITAVQQANVSKLVIVKSSNVKGSSVCSIEGWDCTLKEICVNVKGVPNCLCPDNETCSSGERAELDVIAPSRATLYCPRTFSPCRDGKECVSLEYVCDGEQDCMDGSDEEDCKSFCTNPGIFQCADGKRCIQEERLCDGIPNCPDSSDEANCWKPSETCAMRCDQNTRCITQSWICDGNYDCLDGNDERECGHIECKTGSFRCNSGQCIPYIMRCDGDNDCFDRSDEQNCTIPRPLPCRASEFKCNGSGECILKDWRCDGGKDCKDGSDEKDCIPETTVCGKMQWSCQSGNQCIPTFWRCDGSKDCKDESDEYGCDQNTCHSGMFKCKNMDCVSMKVLCDGKPDCLDGSDESGKCGIQCGTDCSLTCYVSPDGPVCACEKGYRKDNTTNKCVDINECKEYDPCSQSCMNEIGTYRCVCHPGYMLEPDGYQCKVTGKEPVLLIAIEFELLLFKLRTLDEEILTTSDKNLMIISVDYDVLEQRIFWMDLNAESIKWITMGSKDKGTLVKGIKSDCIAVDWIGRNLYWTDGSAGQINAVSLNTSWRGYPEHTVVIDEDLDQPRSIVLHATNGMMLWSEIGQHPQIEEAGMDGSRRKVLITEQLGWPTGLALDMLSWRIYWSDDKFHCIGSATRLGKDIKLIQLESIQSPFSLTVFEDQVYWSEISSRTVQKIDKKTGKKYYLLLKRHGQPYGLKVMHEVLQPRKPNPCLEKCSHLCLIGPDFQGSCRCPVGLVLASDKLNCISFKDSSFLLIALPTSVSQLYLQKLQYSSKGGVMKTKLVTFSDVTRLSSIDYVIQDVLLFFTVEDGGYIAKFKVRESGLKDWKKVLQIEDSGVSIAVDWITSNVFWIEKSKPQVKVASSDGLYKTVLIDDGLSNPLCLAIHPITGVMCFSDAGSEKLKSSAKIECSSMDGSRRRVLWKKNKMAVGLTFANSGSQLFWADRVLETIESIKLDGSNYKVLRDGLKGMNLFTTSEDILFWTTSTNGSVIWYSKTEQGFVEMEQTVEDLKVYNRLEQKGSNGCSVNNGGCTQICVPNPEGRTCKCSTDQHLLNETFCSEQKRCPDGTQMCKDKLKCVLIAEICNHRDDCLDGSDEKSCVFLDEPKTTSRTIVQNPNRNVHLLTKTPVKVLATSPDVYSGVLPTEIGKKMESRPCNDETCNMRGKCVVENDIVKCQCKTGYTGLFCDKELRPLAIPLTLGSLAVLIVIMSAAGVFLYISRQKALHRTYSYASTRSLTQKSDKVPMQTVENAESSETFLNEAFESEGFSVEKELAMPLQENM